MEPFTFKENILSRVVVCGLFGLAGVIVAIACIVSLLGDGFNFAYILPGLLGAIIAAILFWFVVSSVRNRQVITVTPDQITSSSRQRGSVTIYWHNLAKVNQSAIVPENLQGVMPVVELLASYYFMLPLAGSSERRGLINLEAKDGTRLSLREHLIYPHRLEQLQQAIMLYAPTISRTQLILKINTNN